MQEEKKKYDEMLQELIRGIKVDKNYEPESVDSPFLKHFISVTENLVALSKKTKDRGLLFFGMDVEDAEKNKQAVIIGANATVKQMTKMFTLAIQENGNVKRAVMLALLFLAKEEGSDLF